GGEAAGDDLLQEVAGQVKLDVFLLQARLLDGLVAGLFHQFFLRLFKAVLAEPNVVKEEIEIRGQGALRLKGTAHGGGRCDRRGVVENPRLPLKHSHPPQSAERSEEHTSELQ